MISNKLLQKPIDNYSLDFFCHELMLGLEVDGYFHSFLKSTKKIVLKKIE